MSQTDECLGDKEGKKDNQVYGHMVIFFVVTSLPHLIRWRIF